MSKRVGQAVFRLAANDAMQRTYKQRRLDAIWFLTHESEDFDFWAQVGGVNGQLIRRRARQMWPWWQQLVLVEDNEAPPKRGRPKKTKPTWMVA